MGLSGPVNADVFTRAVVGGVDYAIGGWGQYEIDRRRARWKATGKTAAHPDERPGARYKGRTYIHADDAARSVLGSRLAGRQGPSVLQRAALRLADALGVLEDHLCYPDDTGVWECKSATALRPGAALSTDFLTIPPLTSADLRDFAANLDQEEADPDALQALSRGVLATAASVGAPLPALPTLVISPLALPTQAVAVTDDEAVLRLEAAAAPYVARIEALQSALASQLDTAATAILHATTRGKKMVTFGGAAPADHGKATRGEEVDAAVAQPPLALLNAGLPWRSGARAFDLHKDATVVVPTRTTPDGIYFGIANRNNKSRATLLTPHIVSVAAFKTSGRMYAWFVLDSPEGRYIIRAAPQGGHVVRIEADAIVEWLKPRLTGDPPHKIAATEYLAHLRSLGLEILESTRGNALMRFDLVDATTAAERKNKLAELRALTLADFMNLDWTSYDDSAGREPCRTIYEVAGDVVIDLVAKTVMAPKVRPGTLWASFTHNRSYITFHTHPLARYRGSRAEPPSPTDVLLTLEECALDMLAWTFVSAPEGTYIMRPSQALASAFRRNPQEVANIVSTVYSEGLRACEGATAICSADAVRTLGEAGFIAYLRDVACAPLLPVPDIFPTWNQKIREVSRADHAALAETSAEDLVAIDWGPVAAVGESPTIQSTSWMTAGLSKSDQDGVQRAVPSGDGHGFGSAADPNSYPSGVPGPLLVVYFPDEGDFPTQVPQAALDAARKNEALWAWVVFLSPSRLVVFRAGPAGVELHGPVPRTTAAAKGPPAQKKAVRHQNYTN